MIAWLAAQEWSNGRVGMYGTSWSGFNSLQVACLRPPALGAIVPIYASDDRYTDDVHYMGGALKAVDLVDWALYMVACNALPPCPPSSARAGATSGDARIEGRAVAARWLEEQVDGPYWRHGSVRPGYDADRVPDDDRRRLGRRLHEHHAPRVRGARAARSACIIGPWGHMSTGDLATRARTSTSCRS